MHPGLNLEQKDKNGNTFLSIAAQSGNVNVIELLVKKQANVNAINV